MQPASEREREREMFAAYHYVYVFISMNSSIMSIFLRDEEAKSIFPAVCFA